MIIILLVKVALFGASGLLGWSIYQELKRRGLVSFQYSQQPVSEKNCNSFNSLDLSADELVTRELFDLWPDAIINCAAISSPDMVKKDPAHAYKINVEAAQKLAQISDHLGPDSFMYPVIWFLAVKKNRIVPPISQIRSVNMDCRS